MKHNKNYFLSYGFISLIICASLRADDQIQIPEGYTQLECTLQPFKRPEAEASFTRPHIPLREGTSINWSGYAAETNFNNPAHTVTKVAGTWIVPTISRPTNNTNTYCSIWVGIDGFSDGTVEQIGTEHDWSRGRQQNYAWFEMYPNYPYEIVGFPVNIGDSISASVQYMGNNVYQLYMINNTHHVYITIPYSYTRSSAGLRTSAEWIVEAPYDNTVLPLSHFSPVQFSNCSATIGNVNETLSQTTHQPLTMITTTDIAKAVPSAIIAQTNGFSVTWDHQ